jgi:gas vesicle protein
VYSLYRFEYDQRLGISIPDLDREWQLFDKATQEEILSQWEEIRGDIPDRVKKLEEEINIKQAALFNEDDFNKSCDINTEISELASTINDLWLWFRSQGEISGKSHY